MSIKVRIPTPLQKHTNNQAEVSVDASDVKGLIEALEKDFPGIKDRICEKDGKMRRFINIYVNEEDIRFLQRDATSLKDGDEISIIPAIAGGQDIAGGAS
ncbi:MAG: MoaD/ThiS family protein [Candidatus Omnitrophica bacterium]|nr:MoaD/ThiS family protein [Candidatus Omnitrophota bacterium]